MDKLAGFAVKFEQHPDGSWSATVEIGQTKVVKYGWTPAEALDAIYATIKALRFRPVGQMRREAVTA